MNQICRGELQQAIANAVGLNGEVPENFKCNICYSVVLDPVSCKHCDHLFCESCFKQCYKPLCPVCNKKANVLPIHKVLKSILNETIIKECPLKCGVVAQTYEKLVEGHLKKDCPKIKVQCIKE